MEVELLIPRTDQQSEALDSTSQGSAQGSGRALVEQTDQADGVLGTRTDGLFGGDDIALSGYSPSVATDFSEMLPGLFMGQ